MIDTQTTVGRLVAERPELTRTFERLGIDYCCGGRKPLAEAVLEKGLDLDEVIGRLEEALKPRDGADRKWLEEPLADLTRHIENEHHGYLRRELPRLVFLSDKVARVHGDHHPELLDLRRVVEEFAHELMDHMHKEEVVLFPAIRARDESGVAEGLGSLTGPIRAMELDHDVAGAGLAEMRRLTDGYQPPLDACGSYKALFHGLMELEEDMHRHVHLENNVLFERVISNGW